jgi:hypothetical protein
MKVSINIYIYKTHRMLTYKDLKEIGFDGMGCIHLAQGRDQWQSLVNTVSLKVFSRPKVSGRTSNLMVDTVAYEGWMWH